MSGWTVDPFAGTVDEESGGFSGVGYLAERGYSSKPRMHHVIIPEPLGVGHICPGHRGVYWAQVETTGRIAAKRARGRRYRTRHSPPA